MLVTSLLFRFVSGSVRLFYLFPNQPCLHTSQPFCFTFRIEVHRFELTPDLSITLTHPCRCLVDPAATCHGGQSDLSTGAQRFYHTF